MGHTVSKKEFSMVGTDEPHFSRRKEILKKYPQIRELYGPDIKLFYATMALVTVQLIFAIAAPFLSSWKFWIAAYVVGGTVTHALSLANHELSHNLAFKETLFNEILAIISNCAQGIPSGITFKKYHLEHHYHQGVDGIDTDIPTEFEGRFFNTTAKKVVWALLQPLFYALRPVLVKPKHMKPMELINLAVVVLFDVLLVQRFGIWAFLFNFFSTLLGMGLHPVAGHFIAEHYEFIKKQETYSYYGPLNWLCFNVGYHNEHHDFPKVAGINLPKIRAIAPEYYEGLNQHPSWVKTIWDYIVRDDIGPFSRVKRLGKSYSSASVPRSNISKNMDKSKDE